MSIFNNLPRGRKGYLSGRFWILGALLLVLLALALVQYRWINQLAEAQRQRSKANLTAALSNVESDFDVEITRAFVAFQVPFAQPDYSERYKEWLLHAPYPSLIRGVYIAKAGQTDSLPKPVMSGEPSIRSTDWRRDLPDLRSQSARVTAFASVPGPAMGFQTFSRGGTAGAFVSPDPQVIIDGNPAFVFPIMPPALRVEGRLVTRTPGKQSPFQRTEIVNYGGPRVPPEWAVVVLDANYISTTLLPRLVQLYFRSPSGSDYEILVVNRNATTSPRVVFPSQSAPPETDFAHPDGRINLFELRLDCFPPSSSLNPIGVVGAASHLPVPVFDDLSEILARKPQTCSRPTPTLGNEADGSWEMLVRYQAGSLDQAIATFRRRNLILSGSVLLVLALGISMVVLLAERARALAEMQADFVLGVSHELRTPLTVIRVAADNLKKGIVENSEQARKYGEIIHSHALELSNMIEETLAFARMQSVSLIRHRRAVAVCQIVKEALSDNNSALRNAGMEVELDLAPDLPPINADVRLTKKCLDNLIQNAIKYAAAGRWMAIRAKKVSRPEGERVQISIEDRGPGISPIDLPHIFEPFYRGKDAEASQVPGIGLGLTLVKRVAAAHGGTVEVVSANGVGFSIFLPPHHLQPDAQKNA